MIKPKQIFIIIFACFVFLLMILPLMVSANDFLTKALQQNLMYLWIQGNIVPIEAKVMGATLMLFGYKYAFSLATSSIVVNGVVMQITWNCIGWQSFLLLFITFFFGFSKNYKMFSIVESLLLGILSIFWVNILRMILTVLLAVHLPVVFRVVFHDYLAAIVTIVFLFLFWWFVYSYILEEKKVSV